MKLLFQVVYLAAFFCGSFAAPSAVTPRADALDGLNAKFVAKGKNFWVSLG